jgi:hypothetical protein
MPALRRLSGGGRRGLSGIRIGVRSIAAHYRLN